MTALTSLFTSIGDYAGVDQDPPRWRSSAWMIALMLTVIASIISSLSYTATADREINRQFDSKLQLYRQAADRIGRSEKMKNQGMMLAAQAAVDASLIDAVPRSRALAEVSNAMSAGVRIEQISLAPADTKSTTANLLQIRGVAAGESQLSGFVTRLSKSQWMRAVVLRSSKTDASDQKARQEFELTATFDGQTSSAEEATSQQ
jgi:Tfp pilus assembly protein PilN